MSAAYIVAQLRIHDRARYDRYVAGFAATLDGYQGQVLAADDEPEAVEGAWEHDRLVLLRFPDRDTAVRWSESAAYRRIATDRHAGAVTTSVLVRGR